MLEREGLVEEPGQDKGTDKIKEGTVEEDGTHLAPFDFTIIGTTGQEHHVWSSQLSIEYENEDQSDGKDKGKNKTRKGWNTCSDNIRTNNSYSSRHGKISSCKHRTQGIAPQTFVKEGFFFLPFVKYIKVFDEK